MPTYGIMSHETYVINIRTLSPWISSLERFEEPLKPCLESRNISEGAINLATLVIILI